MSSADGKEFLRTNVGTFSDFLIAPCEGVFECFHGILRVVLPSGVDVVVLSVGDAHINLLS